VQLSPQEPRQALRPGPFSTFVDKYSIESVKLQKLLGLSEPDFRMRDAELVIRYFAFNNFIERYTGNLEPLLDTTTKLLNEDMKRDEAYIHRQVESFERSIDTAAAIFGVEHAFRKWTGDKYERAFNRAISDPLAMTFSDYNTSVQAVARREEVEVLFKRLCADNPQFRASIEGTTKSIEAISTRLYLWSLNLARCLQRPVRGASLGEGGIEVKWIDPD
jgi:hypothetical protein